MNIYRGTFENAEDVAAGRGVGLGNFDGIDVYKRQHPGSLASAGCISIPESKMIRALRMIDDQAYIVLVRNAEDLLSYC